MDFNSSQFFPVVTTGITNGCGTVYGGISPTISISYPQGQPAPLWTPQTEPEDELAWLRRRVAEVTELVAA